MAMAETDPPPDPVVCAELTPVYTAEDVNALVKQQKRRGRIARVIGGGVMTGIGIAIAIPVIVPYVAANVCISIRNQFAS